MAEEVKASLEYLTHPILLTKRVNRFKKKLNLASFIQCTSKLCVA